MTDTELSELEATARAASPGPWRTEGYSILRYSDGIASAQSNGSSEICNVLLDGDYDPKTRHGRALHNAAYIAATNPDVLIRLIAELRQTKAERDWLVQTLEDEQYCYPGPRMEGGRLICEEQVIECDKCDRYSKEHWLKAAKEATSCRES